MRSALWILALSGMAVGCATQPAPGPIGIDHPANPNAEQAPLPVVSDTLATTTAPSAPIAPGESSPPEKSHMHHHMNGMQMEKEAQ
jgi:hypothetical protein